MAILLSACLVAAVAVLAWAVMQAVTVLRAMQAEARQLRPLRLLSVFGPAVAAAPQDVRSLLAWHPVAAAARKLLPDDFAALDQAAGKTFPFDRALVEQAHARWTADWLEWEQAHTTAYRLKVAEAEAELASDPSSPRARARLDAVEREKLEMYQARYSHYIQVAKALHSLMTA